jgi:hypothetical protein
MAVTKIWHSGGNARETHGGQDGQEVPIDDQFDNGCEFPGKCDSGAEGANCNCMIELHVTGRRRPTSTTRVEPKYREMTRDEWAREERQMTFTEPIEAYRTSMGSVRMNSFLRGQAYSATERGYTSANGERISLGDMLASIDSSMGVTSLSFDAKLFRGVSRSVLEKIQAGNLFIDDAFLSTSFMDSMGLTFGGHDAARVITLLIPKGTHFIAIPGAEGEMLLPRGCVWEVISKGPKGVTLKLVKEGHVGIPPVKHTDWALDLDLA